MNGAGLGIASRLVCSSLLQGYYTKIRRVPILGQIAHGFMRSVLPSGTRVSVTVRGGLARGLSLSVDPRYEARYAEGLHENTVLECLASHLRPGDVYYDVGAHIGLIAMVAARLVGPTGKVFAFEADPENSPRVRDHARANSLPQVDVIPSAVWCESKTLQFQRASVASSRNTGGVIDAAVQLNSTNVISIQAVKLDAFAQQHPAPRVIKIDVEGAEYEVLRGAETVFRAARPILICEVHNADVSNLMSNWLGERNYRCKWLGGDAAFPRHLVAEPEG